jgi:hypothetical protein
LDYLKVNIKSKITFRRSCSFEFVLLFECKHDLSCWRNACVVEFFESKFNVNHSSNNSPMKDTYNIKIKKKEINLITCKFSMIVFEW